MARALGLAIGCAALLGCASPPTEQVWVTTDNEGARLLQQRLESPVGSAHTRGDGLVTLPLRRGNLQTAAEAMHEELRRCGGFMLEPELGALRSEAPRAQTRALEVAIDNAATVTALMAPLTEAKLRETIQALVDFGTRFHESESGHEASLWIRDRWQAYAAGRADVQVELIEHEGTPQPSISLTLQGAKLPNERVVLGGHMDSINSKGGAAPGADDNASGIAVLDDVARVALELGYTPDRTVVFYAYAAEEIGLVGSAEIAASADDEQQNILGVLQLDMTNYNPEPDKYLAIVTDYTDAALNQFARELIEKYVGMPWQDTECGYACSDHGSWRKHGFAAHYVHESSTDVSNDKIHTAQDTLALSNGSAQHSLHFAKYAAAFMAELAKGGLPPPDQGSGGAAGSSGADGAVAGSAGSGGMAGFRGGAAGSAGDAGGLGGAIAAAGMTFGVAGTAGSAMRPAAVGSSPGAPSSIDGGCACRAAAGSRTGRPPIWLSWTACTLVLVMRGARRRWWRSQAC